VFVEAGAASGDRVSITSGIDPTDEVVVQGALSLYAESKKSEQSESAAPATPPVNSKVAAPSESQLNPWGVGAAAVGVVVLGGFVATRLGRRSK
jgi:cation efflux system membrane fusion protein